MDKSVQWGMAELMDYDLDTKKTWKGHLASVAFMIITADCVIVKMRGKEPETFVPMMDDMI